MRTKLVLGMVLALLLVSAACVQLPTTMTTQQTEQQQTEANQKTLIANQPAPQITKSLERENIIRRIELMNDQNKVFYVYLVSFGKVMSFFTAKGKISSVNSYLTSYSQIVGDPDCLRYRDQGSGTGCFFPVEAPDLDGTYGENGDAVYFFTTENNYVEWRGDYMVSDAPLKLTTPAEIVRVTS